MSEIDTEALRTAKRNARAGLLAIPGVHAVGIGPKMVGGAPTSELAIVVFVLRKKPVAELAADHVIPDEIDGFKTDVVQRRMPTLMADDVDKVDDTSSYRPLTGGVQVQVGLNRSYGTVGFYGVLQESPNAEVVGVTNWHVIAAGHGIQTNLEVEIVPGVTTTITFSKVDSEPIPEGTVGYFGIAKISGTFTGYDYFVRSVAGDTPATIASKLNTEINALTGSGVTSTVSGAVVSVTAAVGGTPTVTAQVFGSTRPDPNAELSAKVEDDTIVLSGSVPGDHYGLLVAVNWSAPEHATDGLFVPLYEGQSLNAIAEQIKLKYEALGPFNIAVVDGSKISLDPATQIETYVWRDRRVGQPWNSLTSGCCDCCVDEIGVTADAHYGLDAAILRLYSPFTAPLQYLAEVKDIGYLVGYHTVEASELTGGYPVKKRGRTTGVRSGTITHVDVDGIIAPSIDLPGQSDSDPVPRYSPRKYDGVIEIVATGDSPSFSDRGDSGSAILHAAGSGYEVVGLLFGGAAPDPGVPGDLGYTLATPIQPILEYFKVNVATATGLGQTKTVPQPTSATAWRQRSGALAETPSLETPTGALWERAASLEQRLSKTVAGAGCAATLRRHLREVNTLINQNRRVTVAWQRNGGPIIVAKVVRALHDSTARLPSMVLGKSWAACLGAIAASIAPHASPALRAELDGPVWASLLTLGGKTLDEFVESHCPPEAEICVPSRTRSFVGTMGVGPLPPAE